MKRGKRLTLEQKSCAMAHGLNPNDYMFVGETEFFYRIVHKDTKTIKSIDKFRRFKNYGKK